MAVGVWRRPAKISAFWATKDEWDWAFGELHYEPSELVLVDRRHASRAHIRLVVMGLN